MINKLKIGVVVIASFLMIGCNITSAKMEKENTILTSLRLIKSKGVVFGHQDDLAYGVSWKSEKGNSDVKRVCGDYPAMFGWELGGMEMGHAENLDKVNFDEMRDLAIFGHEMGGINTFSWHPYNVINGKNSWNTDTTVVEHILSNGAHHKAFLKHLDKVAAFLSSLKDKNGKQVPFIFRPWHEMDGSWFWWGEKYCTHQQLKELFILTVDYLKKTKGVEGMLVAYSPDRNFETAEEYLTWYPGDAYIDILGTDNYWDMKQEGGEVNCIKKLHVVIDLANEKGKLSALTETGLEFVKNPTWYSKVLGVVLADEKVKTNLSYAMVWRNDPKVHHYFPYPGHEAESDAKEFLSQDHILTLTDFKKKN